VLLSYAPSSAQPIKAYDTFDLSASWTIDDTVSLRADIDNLFDKQPVLTVVSDGFPRRR
jgi:outer membrane receptor protein involved in Fe transport